MDTPFAENRITYTPGVCLPNATTAVIVASTKKYSFIWNLFFGLIEKFWPDRDVNIFLMSDDDGRMDAVRERYGVSTFKCAIDIGFVESFEYMARKMKEFGFASVIPMQEDFLVEGPVDAKQLAVYVDAVKKYGFVRLAPCPGGSGAPIEIGGYPLRFLERGKPYNFSFQIAVWNTDFLISILHPSKGIPIQPSEHILSRRVDASGVVCLSVVCPKYQTEGVFKYDPTGIVLGKVRPRTLEIARIHGIPLLPH